MSILGNPLVLCPALLAVTRLPEDVTAAAGETVRFTLRASGPALSGAAYQWQYWAGNRWYNSPAEGNDTPTLTLEATEARNGLQYHCVLTGAGGLTLTTNAVTLTVTGG